MKKMLIILIFLVSSIQANNLKEKYEVYTEYLGMKSLNLNKEQLQKIIPKLEKKLSNDENYKKIRLQAKLNRLSQLDNSIEQTICFTGLTLSSSTGLKGGSCNGRNLSQMNKDGWKLIQVVSGLNIGFGMVFTREKQ